MGLFQQSRHLMDKRIYNILNHNQRNVNYNKLGRQFNNNKYTSMEPIIIYPLFFNIQKSKGPTIWVQFCIKIKPKIW